MTAPSFADSVRRIVPLAWPVLVGQLAVLAFSTVDTVLVARHSAADLAALAIGISIVFAVIVGNEVLPYMDESMRDLRNTT